MNREKDSSEKIAAQLYTVREFTQTPADIRLTLKKISNIGYKSIQVSAFGKIDPSELKEIIDENGLSICVTHTSYDRLTNDLDAVIAEHKLWSCTNIGLGAMPDQFRGSCAATLEFTKIFNPIAQKIKDSGLTFHYHNHNFEFLKENGKNAFDVMVENTDEDVFKFLVDTYWVQAGGANPAKFIEDYKQRISIVHLKDMRVINNNEGRTIQTMAEVGEGNMDFTSIMHACQNIGVKWMAVEQDDCNGKNPFECLELSFNNIGKM